MELKELLKQKIQIKREQVDKIDETLLSCHKVKETLLNEIGLLLSLLEEENENPK